MTTMWSFSQSSLLHRPQGETYCSSIHFTQLAHYLIDLMMYNHSKTCAHAGTQEQTLRVGQQCQLYQNTSPKDKLAQMKLQSVWKTVMQLEEYYQVSDYKSLSRLTLKAIL